MRKTKKAKKTKKQHELSAAAQSMIAKLHDVIVKEVTKMDKKLKKEAK